MHVQIQKINQKGFTLLELLLALGVSGILLGSAVLSIYQVSWGTIRTNDQLSALTAVNSPARYIRQDLQMAQFTNLSDGDPSPQSSLSMYWLDMTLFSTGTNSHTVEYSLSSTELYRTYNGTTSVVGRGITYIGFKQNGEHINCVITADASDSGQQTKTLEFTVRMRSFGMQ